MADIAAIAPLIRNLDHAGPSDRRRAAREIFELGWKLAQPALENWLRDEEFSLLAGPGASGAKSRTPDIAVGLAVHRETFDRIRAANGAPRLASVPPEHGVDEFELVFPENFRLSILAARQPEGNGPIAKFLAKFGEGIQQVELRVRSVERATRILRARFGLKPVYPAARAGADGARVNFFLVPAEGKARKKVLIELLEPLREIAPPRRP